MNFKERAREEAVAYGSETGQYSAFLDGAEWGMRQAVEALRRSRRPETYYESGEWADWLLEKAGMEDG